MSLSKVFDLFANLKALNGRNVVVSTESGQSKVFEPFQFDASTCWNIAKDLNLLKKQIEIFEEAREQLAARLGVDVNSATFSAGLAELLKKEVEISGLLPLKLAGLRLDRNAIQPGILADLESAGLILE